MPRITKTLISAMKPQPTRVFVWDSDPPGFGLCVMPSGAASFVYQYRTPQGATRRIKIGGAKEITPDQARSKAHEHAANIRVKNADPLDARRAEREKLTVDQLLDLYLSSPDFASKARSTQEIDRGRIDNHIRPLLGNKIADNLTDEAIRRAKTSVEEGGTAKNEKTGWRARSHVRGGEGAARQVLRLLRAILAWGVRTNRISRNAAIGVPIGKDKVRSAILNGSEDYRRLFATLDRLTDGRRIRPAVADAIRVIALTGARRDEIAGLSWGEVDLASSLIVIPAERHKTGRKTQTVRTIGLPSLASEIIGRQPRSAESDLVFPPTRGEAAGLSYPGSRKGAPPRLNLAKPWRLIRAEANLPEGIGLHGLRHSLATHMAMQGAQAAQIMVALGHRDMATSQKYIHAAEDARVAIAEKAAATIMNGIGVGNGKPRRRRRG